MKTKPINQPTKKQTKSKPLGTIKNIFHIKKKKIDLYNLKLLIYNWNSNYVLNKKIKQSFSKMKKER